METLNLVELLKGCPKGTPFYCRAHGVVTFDYIEAENNTIYCLAKDIYNNDYRAIFNSDGTFFISTGSEQILFPFKGGDWNTYRYNWEEFKLLIDTPVITIDGNEYKLEYYAGGNKVFNSGNKSTGLCISRFSRDIIIPAKDFDFEHPFSEENLSKNIVNK